MKRSKRRIGEHVHLNDPGAFWDGVWAGELRHFQISNSDGSFHKQGEGDTTRTFRLKIHNRIRKNRKFIEIYT